VTQVARELTLVFTAQGITVQLDGPEQLGMVALRAHTFRRALLDLVHNAMDAMPQGGTLRLAGRRQEATVSLEVQNTDSGIPPEHPARIFEPLYTTKPGGTGLGGLYCAGGGDGARRPGGDAEYSGAGDDLYPDAPANRGTGDTP
jgi:signal transduction histidine kinase